MSRNISLMSIYITIHWYKYTNYGQMNMFEKILFLKNASYSEKGSTFNIHMRLQHSSQGLLFSANGCFLFNYFLCWLPGRQELNSRQKCGNKFGVCFSPSLFIWDYFSHEYSYSMILRTAVSESEILVKNDTF